MIELKHGNLLKIEAEALVNTVNCVGVMGKGIALQFRQAYPQNFSLYERACRAGKVQPGQMFTVPTHSLLNPKYIINFPTKRHWKGKSKIEDIRTGLSALVNEIQRLKIRSIAIPPLGCGNGGLKWSQVAPLIKSALAELPNVQIYLFEPGSPPDALSMPIATQTPNMTRGRALLIKLMELYRQLDYRLSLLEIQKLAYFLQVAGEPLKLNYTKGKFGPYANNLNHVLQRMEGHFIHGYGDRTTQAGIGLAPEAISAADLELKAIPDSVTAFERVARLIQGFETPLGMELLATVHWVAQHKQEAALDPLIAVAEVQAWNASKRIRLKVEYIRKAWQRLNEQGWLGTV